MVTLVLLLCPRPGAVGPFQRRRLAPSSRAAHPADHKPPKHLPLHLPASVQCLQVLHLLGVGLGRGRLPLSLAGILPAAPTWNQAKAGLPPIPTGAGPSSGCCWACSSPLPEHLEGLSGCKWLPRDPPGPNSPSLGFRHQLKLRFVGLWIHW